MQPENSYHLKPLVRAIAHWRLKEVGRLRACEALLDSYAQRVFDAHEENR